jgi:hypothetical protein
VSAVKLGIVGKLDFGFLAEWQFFFPVWSCFIHAESPMFPNMPGSRDTEGEYFLELAFGS